MYITQALSFPLNHLEFTLWPPLNSIMLANTSSQDNADKVLLKAIKSQTSVANDNDDVSTTDYGNGSDICWRLVNASLMFEVNAMLGRSESDCEFELGPLGSTIKAMFKQRWWSMQMAAQRHASFATTTRHTSQRTCRKDMQSTWIGCLLPGYQLNAQHGANTILYFQQSALIKKQTKIAFNITHTPCGSCV